MRFLAGVARMLATGLLIALGGPVAAQQTYPTKPIRFIVPNPPGGSVTATGRRIGQKLTESWGQAVIIDNRPGGYGFIGGEALTKALPDGYSFLVMSSTHILSPLLYSAPYDAIKDFAPVATLARSEYLLVLHPSVPASNLQDFIAYAKSRPGELNYASSGGGSPLHLAAELFNIMTGVKTQHIPYKGGGPAMIDLIGGQVQLSFQTPISIITHIKSGKVKAMAITGKARSSFLPQVPTFIEAGLPGFEVLGGWFGILAPAATPRRIIDRVSTEIARILALPETKETYSSQGMVPFISTPDQFAELLKTQTARFARIIKEANIKIEK